MSHPNSALPKPLHWMVSSKKDLLAMPLEVQREMGYALHIAQTGERGANVRVMQGFGGAHVLEVRDSFSGDAYRAIYTVRFARAIYVLHCFQKKSKSGIATDLQDVELIRARLKLAQDHYGVRYENEKEQP